LPGIVPVGTLLLGRTTRSPSRSPGCPPSPPGSRSSWPRGSGPAPAPRGAPARRAARPGRVLALLPVRPAVPRRRQGRREPWRRHIQRYQRIIRLW